jgi:hypothetical protein
METDRLRSAWQACPGPAGPEPRRPSFVSVRPSARFGATALASTRCAKSIRLPFTEARAEPPRFLRRPLDEAGLYLTWPMSEAPT